MDSITLYKRDAKNVVRVWAAEIDYGLEALLITHGVLNGEMQEKEEFIEEGKGGRDIDEQLESRLNSRANKKLDQGYVKTIEATSLPKTNSLGLFMPMKAQPTIDKNKKLKKNIKEADWSNAFIQRKYNGTRALTKGGEEGVISYSRGSKLITTLSHISDEMSIPFGVTVDGEVYHHGTPLQTINSWVKRLQPNTLKLKLVVYDLISNEPFEKRFGMLSKLNLGDNVIVAETIKVNSFDEAMALFHKFREEGYEGAIVRQGNKGYECDIRSKSTLKLKSWSDEEFTVIDVTESPDGLAVLHMETEEGETFKATAPGTRSEKLDVLRNKDEYIGFSVTIRYPEKTISGKPSQPVAVAWRSAGE